MRGPWKTRSWRLAHREHHGCWATPTVMEIIAAGTFLESSRVQVSGREGEARAPQLPSWVSTDRPLGSSSSRFLPPKDKAVPRRVVHRAWAPWQCDERDVRAPGRGLPAVGSRSSLGGHRFCCSSFTDSETELGLPWCWDTFLSPPFVLCPCPASKIRTQGRTGDFGRSGVPRLSSCLQSCQSCGSPPSG